MSPATLAFLMQLLDSVSLTGSDPDLVMRAQQIAQAKVEVSQALSAAGPPEAQE
jgi:hypothetical protein